MLAVCLLQVLHHDLLVAADVGPLASAQPTADAVIVEGEVRDQRHV
jgi:hypothetical protein